MRLQGSPDYVSLPLVHAEPCGSTNVFDCSNENGTGANSFLTVYHRLQDETSIVPNTGEHWTVTARYATGNTGSCPCESSQQTEYVATFEIDLVAGVWVYGNGVGDSVAPFNGITLCDSNTRCAGGGYWYKLRVNLDKTVLVPCPGHDDEVGYLCQVLYKTKVVDGAVDCSLMVPKSANSQTFQTADNGQYECDLDVSCPPGLARASLTIRYN